jgi:hypothetical protein
VGVFLVLKWPDNTVYALKKNNKGYCPKSSQVLEKCSILYHLRFEFLTTKKSMPIVSKYKCFDCFLELG